MDQPLELSISLVDPPASSPPETIASIELRCDQLGLLHRGDLLIDPLTPREREDLSWYLEEYAEWPYEQFLERGKKVEALLVELGKRLYGGVFGSAKAMSIVQPWRLQPLQPVAQRQISIISELPKVLSLPWELLHDEQGFLVLRTRNPISLIRRLPQHELSTFPVPFEPPLRILLVTARPDDAGFIDPRSIARELLDEVQPQIDAGTIAVEFLRPPTLHALRQRLGDSSHPPVHIFHFDGHGTFGEDNDGQAQLVGGGRQGMLAFEYTDGNLDLVEAGRVAQVLQDSGVRLAVLTACQSARSSEDDAFSSVAAQLIRSGVDAVIAMRAAVLVTTAARYAEAFYRSLAHSDPAPLAQARAQQALHDDPRRDVHHRRRDDEGNQVTLQDWWLPHYYQQRPLQLQRTAARRRKKAPPSSLPPDQNLEMPKEPRYGFSGRSHELLQIERHLRRGKLLVIHGFGGTGKTALTREAAAWLTRTKMYDGACFTSFEHGGDAATLLRALGMFLNVYDGHYNPGDTRAALEKLLPLLKEKRVLVIADNLESILPGGEVPLEAAARSELWNALLALASAGTGVLLTSRDTAFGDARLAPGSRVAYLALRGLHPDDGYALASAILTDLGVERRSVPYAELRDLLKLLDYLPLAIQVVLPALRTWSPAKIKADFTELLSTFVDDTEAGRNHSLSASLEYSLRRLSEEQRRQLIHLALFQGGASENNLLAITEIPETSWAPLRSALEQAALVTTEQIHPAILVPYIRFHPMLAPFLRTQPGAHDVTMYKRYTEQYASFASYLYHEDYKYPIPIRAIALQELPNLRRALEMLLEAGEREVASEMAEHIAKFLRFWGLKREHDALRLRVTEAVTTPGDAGGGTLSFAEYARETGMGNDELRDGSTHEAITRFTRLLARIEALTEGTVMSRGSYEHSSVLGMLAQGLAADGQLQAATERLREALTLIDALIAQQPDERQFIRQRGSLLIDLGDVLRDRGQFPQAEKAYREALKVAKRLVDQRQQAVVLTQYGTLARRQGNFAEARSRYREALNLFRALGEPIEEATLWHQLGMIAQQQGEWAEAERCYRRSLAISEQLDEAVAAAKTCNNLALLAEFTDRPSEAEGWYKRALELDNRVQPGSFSHARDLNNLAALLISEVRAGAIPPERLAEARDYAEQALTMRQMLDEAGAEISSSWHNLAAIAELEGRSESARDYRHRERETYAAFPGNRYETDEQFGSFIDEIAASVKGSAEARARVEAVLQGLGPEFWQIASAIHRIWAGERDWNTLAEELDGFEALVVLRVLETLQEQQKEAE